MTNRTCYSRDSHLYLTSLVQIIPENVGTVNKNINVKLTPTQMLLTIVYQNSLSVGLPNDPGTRKHESEV